MPIDHRQPVRPDSEPAREAAGDPGASHLDVVREDAVRKERSAQLFRAHHKTLIRALLPILKSEAECEDIAQQAQVIMFELEHPETINYHAAYLFRIARNLAEDRRRQLAARKRIDESLAQPGASLPPDRTVEARQELALLSQAIDELPPLCREAFLLIQFDDYTMKEAAAKLGIPAWTVRRLVARALEHCQKAVAPAKVTRQGEST